MICGATGRSAITNMSAVSAGMGDSSTAHLNSAINRCDYRRACASNCFGSHELAVARARQLSARHRVFRTASVTLSNEGLIDGHMAARIHFDP